METIPQAAPQIAQPTQQIINHAYQVAANMLVKENRASYEVIDHLKQMGIDHSSATIMVDNLEAQINNARSSRAKKDMLYGALWCVGGLVLTMAHIGFIFWGAIVFGGIQFFRGASNL